MSKEFHLSIEEQESNKIYDFNVDITNQIKISIESDTAQMMQVFIEKNNETISSALIISKTASRDIYIGQTINSTSPTSKVVNNLSGEWKLKFQLNKPTDKKITIKVSIEENDESEIVRDSQIDIFDEKVVDKIGWVAGDFHTHTVFSDGSMTQTDNIQSAKNQGLDFFFATDHNLVTRHWPDQEEVLVLPAYEHTSTQFGHGIFLGMKEQLITSETFQSLNDQKYIETFIENKQKDSLFTVAHPYLEPWEWHADISVDTFHNIELMNEPTYHDNIESNKKAFDLWSRLWNVGVLTTGIGGSDSHMLPSEKYDDAEMPSLIGDPKTYVYVEELSLDGILNSLKAGHTKVSRIGTLEFTSPLKADLLPGNHLDNDVERFGLKIIPDYEEVYVIRWVFDGTIISETTGLNADVEVNILDDSFHWLRCDILRTNGEMVGTVNPVYWGKPVRTISKISEVL